MHAAIRARLAPETRILYGGSVNSTNAAAILALDDVDGALVGGASLDADSFWAIAALPSRRSGCWSDAAKRLNSSMMIFVFSSFTSWWQSP